MNVDAVIMDMKLITPLAAVASVHPKSIVTILSFFITMLIIITCLIFLRCLVCIRLCDKLFIIYLLVKYGFVFGKVSSSLENCILMVEISGVNSKTQKLWMECSVMVKNNPGVGETRSNSESPFFWLCDFEKVI